jgi:cell division protein FtsN
MNRYTSLTALLLFALLLGTLPATASHDPFLDCSISQLQKRSAEEGKLYFLLFTADFVMTCQWMEKETFMDQALLSYLEQSYIGLRVDISQPEGERLQQQYDVTQLPSVLVFSARGQLLGRHIGAIPAEALQSSLQAYDLPANRQSMQTTVEAAEADILPSPQPILQLSMPRLVPDVPATTASIATTASYIPKAQSVRQRQVNTNYYTVQIGVFGAEANAKVAKAQLASRCTADIRIIRGSSNGSPIYRLYAGAFPDKATALSLQQELAKLQVDGFVKLVRL